MYYWEKHLRLSDVTPSIQHSFVVCVLFCRPGAIAKQVEANKRNATHVSFAKARRHADMKPLEEPSPGPAAYRPKHLSHSTGPAHSIVGKNNQYLCFYLPPQVRP